jgi:Flp pilus assembly protein TadB
MIKFLTYPFNTAIREIKRDNQFRKKLEDKGSKKSVSPFIAMSCMFILMMSFMYIYFLYLLVGSIFVEPLGFIFLPIHVLLAWIFTLIYTKIFPKTRKNYLKSMGLYSEYEINSKNI